MVSRQGIGNYSERVVVLLGWLTDIPALRDENPEEEDDEECAGGDPSIQGVGRRMIE